MIRQEVESYCILVVKQFRKQYNKLLFLFLLTKIKVKKEVYFFYRISMFFYVNVLQCRTEVMK